MELKDLIQHNIDHEQCLKKLKDIQRHHRYFQDTFSIEPDLVSIGHLGVIIEASGLMFKPWLRGWYWHILPCQNCGKMIRRWPPFVSPKGMKRALVSPEKDGRYRFLCLLCTLPTRAIYEKIRRHHLGKYCSPIGFLDLVTFGGKYWPFGVVTEGGRVKKQIIEKLRKELTEHSVQQVSYICGKYTIILDDDTELELSFHDVHSLRMRK